jgi:hypothetical protein
MAVDVKKLIAAINPGVYCSDSYDEKGEKLSSKIKKLAKQKGYLKAAETAELKESDYLDVLFAQLTQGAFEKAGLKSPIEQHTLVYDASSQSLEPIYFWILDYVNKQYGDSEKLIDNFLASPGSGHFSEMQGRVSRLQEEGMKMMQTAGILLKSVLNIIYDLKEFKIRLYSYNLLKSKDEQEKRAALLSLKQIWMDNVDIKRGVGSINGLSQQLDFVTIRDAFMTADSLKDVEKMDLNERVKRILSPRIAEFLKWVEESERELRKRFEVEKIYLKSQINSLKLYARWAKPYFKAVRELEQNAPANAGLVNAFNTVLFELVLLAKGKYDFKKDVGSGDLPKVFLKKKLRTCHPLTIIEFSFRSIPDRSDQRGGYSFRGRAEVSFTSFALNDDELKILREQIEEDDFGDVYKMIEGATDETLGKLKDDIEELLGEKEEKKEEEEKKEAEDANPFGALFSGFWPSKSEVKEKSIAPDNEFESVLRSQAALNARYTCRKLYDAYKKAHGMPAFPPVMK